MAPTNESLRYSVLIICTWMFYCVTAQQGEGDICNMRWSGKKGVCRLQNDCVSALFLRLSGVKPSICGDVGNGYFYQLPSKGSTFSKLGDDNPMVCCADGVRNTRKRGSGGSIRNKGGNRGNGGNGGNRGNGNIVTKQRVLQELSSEGRSSVGGNSIRRISEIKCEEYSSGVEEVVEGMRLGIAPVAVTRRVSKCDYSRTPLIVGGEEAQVGEFPHMVLIGWLEGAPGNYDWNCGGSLVSENFVLTAGHCTFHRELQTSPSMVRLGEHNIKKDDDGASPENIPIKQIIKHPEYSTKMKYHDIALLKLAFRPKFRKLVRPACLYQGTTYTDQKVIATGWGAIAEAQRRSDALLKVSLNVIDRNTCSTFFRSYVRTMPRGLIDEQLCVGDLAGGKDTCQGDSGGPLQVSESKNRCIFYIVGVTSFGVGCGSENSPAVYTNVASYIDWLEKTIWG